MEPVTSMNRVGFQDLTSSTWRQEVTKQQHGHGLPKARGQSAEDVIGVIFIQCALQDVIVQLETLLSADYVLLGLTWKPLS